MVVVDLHHEFLKEYFKVNNKDNSFSNIKQWCISTLENYLFNIQENYSLIEYSQILYKFNDTEFENYKRILNKYFKTKMSDFYEAFFEEFIDIERLKAEFTLKET